MWKQCYWTWLPLQALEILQENLDRKNCESLLFSCGKLTSKVRSAVFEKNCQWCCAIGETVIIDLA